MGSDAVFLEQRLLREVELQRVIRTQADVKASLEELRYGVTLVSEEERVVTERAHGDADLLEIKEVLQCRNLAQEDAVRDGMRRKECGSEMIGVACFAGVGAEDKRV